MIKCKNCKTECESVEVSVKGTKIPVTSYQCPICHYYSFDKKDAQTVIEDLKEV